MAFLAKRQKPSPTTVTDSTAEPASVANDELSDYHPLPFHPSKPVSPAQVRSIRHEFLALASRRMHEEEVNETDDGDGDFSSLEAEVRRRTLLGPAHVAANEARLAQAAEIKALASARNIGLTSRDINLHYKRMGQFLDRARQLSAPPLEEEEEEEEEGGAYTLPSAFHRRGRRGGVVREFDIEALNAPAWDANGPASHVAVLSRRSHATRAAAHSVLEAVRQLELRHGDHKQTADRDRRRPADQVPAPTFNSVLRNQGPVPSNRRKADKELAEALHLSRLRASLAFLHEADSDSDSDASNVSGSTGSASTV